MNVTDGEVAAGLEFLNKGYIWNPSILKEIFKVLNEFKSSDLEETNTREFLELFLELEEAHRNFIKKIEDLPMIMNCRAKGDTDIHFGGQECAEFMKDIISSVNKFIKYLKDIGRWESSVLTSVMLKIREKAKSDEKYAWEFERKTKQNYISLGIDNSLKILKEAGYVFE